jgi:EpsI family protein
VPAPALLRTMVLSAALSASGVALSLANVPDIMASRLRFSALPLELDTWTGVAAPELAAEVQAVLGADDYLNRVYHQSDAASPVGLYAAYYASQRQGESIHSPLNCLPGSGWQPVRNTIRSIPAGGRTLDVNDYIVEKNGNRVLVLYWYQSHGRVVASEYWGKFYLVADAIRMRRTDAALVRIMVPISGTTANGEAVAVRLGEQFVQALFPALERYIPA